MTALVAIVGRPNVGKSTLFNRLIGSRKAIVEDNPGVTRDRMYGVAQWEGRSFLVVDTGGIDPSLDTGIPAHIAAQADVAMEEADMILFVVDARAGTTATDQDIADRLRRGGKPVVVVANKADSPKRDDDVAESYALGVGEVFPVSAAHGRGVAELCDAILDKVGADEEDVELIPPGIRIAFLGRPNAGKSTMVNSLLGGERVIVSETPGTTRDAIYLPLKHGNDDWVVIDLSMEKAYDRLIGEQVYLLLPDGTVKGAFTDENGKVRVELDAPGRVKQGYGGAQYVPFLEEQRH